MCNLTSKNKQPSTGRYTSRVAASQLCIGRQNGSSICLMPQSYPLFVFKLNPYLLRYYSTPTSSQPKATQQKPKVANLLTECGIKSANPLNNDKPMLVYEDFVSYKRIIIAENKGKSGIYMITNKQTLDIYVGQAGDLTKRYLDYIRPGYISQINKNKTSIIGRALEKYGYPCFSFTILEYCSISDLTVREQYYFDRLNPVYNILKKAAAVPNSVRGYTRSEETKQLQSLKKRGELNPLYGKSHSEETKEIIRQKALGRKASDETKALMASKRGIFICVYEKCLPMEGVATVDGFKLIGSFASARRVGDYLGISHSTVRRYLDSGILHKDRHKFTSYTPKGGSSVVKKGE